jgi:hypothetical protein
MADKMKAGQHTLGDDFDMEGSWWLPGHSDEQAVHGVLRYRHTGGTRLDLDDFLPGRGDSSSAEARGGNTIFGCLDTKEECSLWDCHFDPRVDSHSIQVDDSSWVGRFVIGAHIQSEEEVCFRSVSENYWNLEDWLGRSPFPASGILRLAELTSPDHFTIEVAAAEYRSGSSAGASSGNSAAYTPLITTRTSDARSARWYSKTLYDLGNLLTLLVGQPMSPRWVDPEVSGCGSEVKHCRLFGHRGDRDHSGGDVCPLVPFRDVRPHLQAVFSAWFGQADDLRPALELLFSTFFGPETFLDARFLTLARAVETFHRRVVGGKYLEDEDAAWLECREAMLAAVPAGIGEPLRKALKARVRWGNEFSLRNRVKSLVGDLEKETAALITSDPQVFACRICDTRNYLTHFDKSLKQGVLDGPDLLAGAEALRILLMVCLLKRIGIDEALVRDRISGHLAWAPSLQAIKRSRLYQER